MSTNGNGFTWKVLAVAGTLVGVIWALVLGRIEKLEAQDRIKEDRIAVLERDLYGIKIELGNLLDVVERIEGKLDKALGAR